MIVAVGNTMRIDDREKFVKLANNRVNKTIKNLQLVGNLANKSNYDYTREDVVQMFNTLREELQRCEQRFFSEVANEPAKLAEFNLSNELAADSYMQLGDRFVSEMCPGKAEKAYIAAWQLTNLSDKERLDLAEKLYGHSLSCRGKNSTESERSYLKSLAILSTISDEHERERDYKIWQNSTVFAWQYRDQGRHEEAAAGHRRAYELHLNKTDHPLDPGLLAFLWSNEEFSCKRYTASLKALQVAMSEFKKLEARFWQGMVHAAMSERYLAKKDKKKAQEHAVQALALMCKLEPESKHPWLTAYMYPGATVCIAKTYIAQGKAVEALKIYQQGLKFGDASGWADNVHMTWLLSNYIELLQKKPGNQKLIKQLQQRNDQLWRSIGK